MGVKDFRSHLAASLKKDEMLIVTQHGQPSKVVMNYEDMLELVDIIDEIEDAATIRTVLEGKKAIGQGAAGVPVSQLFKRVRAGMAKRKK